MNSMLDVKTLFNKHSMIALVIAIIFWSSNSMLPSTPLMAQQENNNSGRFLDQEERANVNVFKQASPSVVNISTQTGIRARRGDVTLDMGRISSGTGSGFLWDAEGHIVTNYHVVEGSDFVKVKLTDGTEWEAKQLNSTLRF